MRRFIAGVVGLLIVIFGAVTVLGNQYYGWGEIRECLLDGAGDEFIVPVGWGPYTGSELEEVVAAANDVADKLTWAPDPDLPGDVWTAADQIGSTGDCEEFAILLCSVMRFSIGIPSSRVWVQGGLIAVPPAGGSDSVPPIFGHAYVVYKSHRGIFYIEPQWGGKPYALYRGSKPSVTHWYVTPPYIWGESAMLRFNDAWVRGGGPYLAGPRH